MIPDDVVEQVREQADIVAIIGETVKLKRVGNSFRGPCPFHQGTHPNFSVSARGGYTCFVCGEKGDVLTFVQKRLGLDFVDAVKYVGAKSGVDVREVSRAREGEADPRERYWEVNAAAAEFFRAQLWTEERGAAARSYLAERGVAQDVADRFGIGFAPRERDLLTTHLHSIGYDDEVLVRSGLLVLREDLPEPRARFRNRVMFPIYDTHGRVIAFGGRVLGEGEPKYLNSAESPTFSKGSTLYGLNWARHAIRKDERVLLVEGYFDCVRLHAAGIESAVAPLGTALTDAQAELLRKYTTNVFLLYDSDQAGLKATFRAGDILLMHGAKVLVVTLPPGEDPDTFVRTEGREGMEAQLHAAVDVFERKLQILQRGGWLTDLRRKRVALDRLMPTVRAASDSITRGLYLARAAEAVGVSRDVLERELRQGGRRPEARPNEAGQDAGATSRAGERRRAFPAQGLSAERELVRLLLHRRQHIEAVAENVGADSFREPTLAQIYSMLLESPDVSVEDIATSLDDESIPVLNELMASDGGLEGPARIIQDCVAMLKQRPLSEEIDAIDRQLPLADDEEKTRLVRRKQQLTREIKALGGRRWKSVRGTR